MASGKFAISPSAIWVRLGAWRKFEPEKFTNEEVEKFKAEWRAAHPNIVELWHALDRAAWTAVRERGRVVRCGCVAFKCTGAFLQLKLPSGRKISSESVREHQAGLQSFRSMRRIDARRKNASALRLRFSQSLASLRQRLSQAMVRSTTQRRGSTTNPLA